MSIRKLWLILMIAIMVVEFIFSAQTGKVSNAVSDSFSHAVKVEEVAPLLNTPSWEIWHIKVVLRKYAHIFLFGLMGMFGFLSWDTGKSILKRIGLTVAICFVYACLDEIHLAFVPGRTSRIFDVFLDLIGIIAGIVVIIVANLIRRNHRGNNKRMR